MCAARGNAEGGTRVFSAKNALQFCGLHPREQQQQQWQHIHLELETEHDVDFEALALAIVSFSSFMFGSVRFGFGFTLMVVHSTYYNGNNFYY